MIIFAFEADKILQAGFGTEIELLSHWKNVVEAVEFFDKEYWLMIICDSGSESKPYIGVNFVDKWKLSTVINISISQFNELNFVFFTCLVLHLDLYQMI